MGFAEAWTHVAGAPSQPLTSRDKLDTMDTIRPTGNSVHTVRTGIKMAGRVRRMARGAGQ